MAHLFADGLDVLELRCDLSAERGVVGVTIPCVLESGDVIIGEKVQLVERVSDHLAYAVIGGFVVEHSVTNCLVQALDYLAVHLVYIIAQNSEA